MPCAPPTTAERRPTGRSSSDFAEPERDDGEVVAAEAEDRRADEEADEGRHDDHDGNATQNESSGLKPVTPEMSGSRWCTRRPRRRPRSRGRGGRRSRPRCSARGRGGRRGRSPEDLGEPRPDQLGQEQQEDDQEQDAIPDGSGFRRRPGGRRTRSVAAGARGRSQPATRAKMMIAAVGVKAAPAKKKSARSLEPKVAQARPEERLGRQRRVARTRRGDGAQRERARPGATRRPARGRRRPTMRTASDERTLAELEGLEQGGRGVDQDPADVDGGDEDGRSGEPIAASAPATSRRRARREPPLGGPSRRTSRPRSGGTDEHDEAERDEVRRWARDLRTTRSCPPGRGGCRGGRRAVRRMARRRNERHPSRVLPSAEQARWPEDEDEHEHVKAITSWSWLGDGSRTR